jgi:hypothetical protein
VDTERVVNAERVVDTETAQGGWLMQRTITSGAAGVEAGGGKRTIGRVADVERVTDMERVDAEKVANTEKVVNAERVINMETMQGGWPMWRMTMSGAVGVEAGRGGKRTRGQEGNRRERETKVM